jgi:LmbE family N-acetylglucosaminyl deacetylase
MIDDHRKDRKAAQQIDPQVALVDSGVRPAEIERARQRQAVWKRPRGWRSDRAVCRNNPRLIHPKIFSFVIVFELSLRRLMPKRVAVKSAQTCHTGCPFLRHRTSSDFTPVYVLWFQVMRKINGFAFDANSGKILSKIWEETMGKRVMGVGAHPDDLEWYAGATIAKLARDGAEITFVICTDGEKGSFDSGADSRQLAAQRNAEQRAAARALGVREVIFLGYADGALEATSALRKELATLYRRYQPDLLLTFDPWKRYELHPDHLAAGHAALDARLVAKMPLHYPITRESAWAIRELWLFNADEPNRFVDVGETLELQHRALTLHRSQTTVWDDAARAFIENRARENGSRIGVQFAEAFRRIVIEGALVVAEGTNS